jgi:prolyl 4-hydroxylase
MMPKELHIAIKIMIVTLVLIVLLWPRNGIYYEIDDFLTYEECDEMIQMAQEKGLAPSLVYSEESDNTDTSHRVSDQAWVNTGHMSLIRKVSSISGKPPENFEEIQVVKYEKGGFFKPHYDACDGGETFCKRMNGNSGQRYMTCLVYLNDDFEGGETVFPKLDVKIIPKKGKALVFFNTDDKGELIRDSLHGGNPVDSGTKWICNVWVRLNKMYA